MENRKRVLLTGGTGFIGSHFLYRLITSHTPVTALVRDGARPTDDGDSPDDRAKDRLLRAVTGAAAAYHDSFDRRFAYQTLSVVVGDVTQENCGIRPEVLAELGQFDEIWHLAALLDFEERYRARVDATNVSGTRHLLALAQALGCKRFVYISTAYTAGRKTGTISEELHDPSGEFNNPYEASKVRAENDVAAMCNRLGMDWRILRPSIVIGPSSTKRPGGSKTGLYNLIRELRAWRSVLEKADSAISISGEPETRLDLVPVDSVVGDMMRLFKSGFGESRIVHLTNPDSPRVRECIAALCEILGIRPFNVVPGHQPQSPVERMLGRRVEFYQAYFRDSKEFERSIPTESAVTLADFRQYVREAVAENSGEVLSAVLRREIVPLRDGTTVASYIGGKNTESTVVLINAFGLAPEFFLPVARRLLPHHRVLLWEFRGSPTLTGELTRESAGLTSHAQDLVDVLTYHGVTDPVHLVGWCSGTQLVHRFARLHENRVKSMCLLMGFYVMDGVKLTSYQDGFCRVMPLISQSTTMAERMWATFHRGGAAAGAMNQIMDGVDLSLIHMLSLPFQSPERLYRYALTTNALLTDSEETHAGSVSKPCLVVGARNDRTAGYEAAEAFAKRCGAQFKCMEEGDHFSLLHDPAVGEMVSSFLESINGYRAWDTALPPSGVRGDATGETARARAN